MEVNMIMLLIVEDIQRITLIIITDQVYLDSGIVVKSFTPDDWEHISYYMNMDGCLVYPYRKLLVGDTYGTLISHLN